MLMPFHGYYIFHLIFCRDIQNIYYISIYSTSMYICMYMCMFVYISIYLYIYVYMGYVIPPWIPRCPAKPPNKFSGQPSLK